MLPSSQKASLTILLTIINISLGILLYTTPYSKTDIQITNDMRFENFDQISDYFLELATTKGAQHAFSVLNYSKFPPDVDMHLLGHVVGNVLFENDGVDGIKICTPDFRNACSHAMVIGEFLERGNDALVTIAQACRDAPGGSGAYTMCFHGLGHGILAFAGYDMEKAVKMCQKVGTQQYSYRETKECIGGATMEILSGVNDLEQWELKKDTYLSTQNPLSPCNASFIPKDQQFFCYLYLTPHFFEIIAGDLGSLKPQHFESSIAFCDQIPLDQTANRDACYGGFGKEFVVLAQFRDIRNIDQMSQEQLKQVSDWCLLAPHTEGIQSCIKYALNSIYWGGENDPQASIDFCEQVPKQYQENCYKEIVGAASYYATDQGPIQTICNKIPQKYQRFCHE